MDQKFYKGLLDSITDGVYYLDLNRRIVYWNKAAERLSGFTAQEVLGKSCADNILCHVTGTGVELCVEGCPMAASMEDGKAREANVFMHHKFGHRVPVFVRASPMTNADGEIVGAVEVFSDNSDNVNILKEMEGLRKEVFTDPLTGVGNRRYADVSLERLEATMDSSKVQYGVVFADVDHFKKVNDTWGHSVGDAVLQMLAKTLSASLRPLDVICRWGGEEFVILIPNCTEKGLAIAAERFRSLVELSWFERDGENIQITSSFGVALSAEGETSESVLERADQQLYLSKKNGRNCVYMNDKRSAVDSW